MTYRTVVAFVVWSRIVLEIIACSVVTRRRIRGELRSGAQRWRSRGKTPPFSTESR
jgi:hypothetical protein